MKVLHIIIGLNTGGAEMMLERLIDAHQHDSLLDHAVVSLTTTGKVGLRLEELGIDVRSLNMDSLSDIPRIFLRLLSIIRSERPFVVQTWLYHADLIGGLAAKLAGVKCIIWGIRTTELKKGSYLTATIRKISAWLSYWIPDYIVVVAESSKKKHMALGYSASKMLVIPNGFNIQNFHATPKLVLEFRQSVSIKKSDLVIGCVGRLSQEKGQDVFIRSAGLVLARFPNCKFVMVGSGLESLNRELVSLIQQNARLDRFVLLGERSDVSLCLSGMDVFCLPSRSEGFPNVLGEAMFAGLPCISSDAGDASVLGGADVPIAMVGDHSDLANKLIAMVEKSDEQRAKIGQRLKQRIINEYSIEKIAGVYQTLYEELERNY